MLKVFKSMYSVGCYCLFNPSFYFQITGFSYGCMIGNVALGAEYVNDTTFICIVQGNQVNLPHDI